MATILIRLANVTDADALAKHGRQTYVETFVEDFAIPYPPSRLEDHYLPDLDRILDAVDRTFGY